MKIEFNNKVILMFTVTLMYFQHTRVEYLY